MNLDAVEVPKQKDLDQVNLVNNEFDMSHKEHNFLSRLAVENGLSTNNHTTRYIACLRRYIDRCNSVLTKRFKV